jgi:hypothetical protein
VIAPPRRCDECGFDAVPRGAPELAAAVRSLGDRFRTPLTSDDPSVRRRPDEKTWSPLEYGAHVRDVIAIWNLMLKQALTQDRPQFPAPDPDVADRAAADGRYDELDPLVVADELAANAERMATKLSSVDGDGWSRAVVLGDEPLSALDIVNKVLHEGHHHLNDIERMPQRWP